MSYKIRYKFEIEKGDFTREQVMEWGGGCDAFMFVSMIRPEDGGLSTVIAGRDGARPGEDDDLSDTEAFKVWTGLASKLKDSNELGEGRRSVCAFALQMVQAALLRDHPCPACGSWQFLEIKRGSEDEWFYGFRCNSCGHSVHFDYRMPRPVKAQDLRG